MLCLPSLVPAKCVSLQLPEILVRAMSWHAIHDCLRYCLVSIVSAHSVRSDKMIQLIKQCHLLGCRKCAFSVVVLAFRNSIYPELCTAPTLKIFWKSLKTWLFSQGLGRVAAKPVIFFGGGWLLLLLCLVSLLFWMPMVCLASFTVLAFKV